MSTGKKKIKIWTIVSLVAFTLSLIIYYGYDHFAVCDIYYSECDWIDEVVGQPLTLFSLVMLPILLTLFFLKDQVFAAWQKFALRYLPIAFGLIFLSYFSDSGGGMGIDLFSFDSEQVSWLAASFFLIISLILIIYKSIKLRKK